MRIRALFALSLALLSCGLVACGTSSQSGSSSTSAGKIITLGVDLPLSGADASVGVSTLNGVKLAVEQANKAGLPGGFTFTINAIDDAVQGVHSPQQGASNMRTFVSDPTVLAVIGPYNSNVAQAQIPISNAAPLLQIGPSVVSDGLTIGDAARALRRTNPNTISFFRVCTTDAHQGSAAASFALKLGWKRAYIVDVNETYGLDLANVFDHDFAKS
ncbi:MAG: ABC transporter substrate-binding protein, partial [Vulcanimicrobiaceae bacterium]